MNGLTNTNSNSNNNINVKKNKKLSMNKLIQKIKNQEINQQIANNSLKSLLAK